MHRKLIILTIFLAYGSGVLKYIRTVVQLISKVVSSRTMETLCPLNNNAPLLPPAPGNHFSTFCLYEFAGSRYLILPESDRICLFVTGIVHSA